MKKSAKIYVLVMAIFILSVCPVAWAGESANVEVLGTDVKLYAQPSVKGKIVGSTSEHVGFLVDSTPIYDKEGKTNWYKMVYEYNPMDDSLFEVTDPLYISAKFLKLKPMSEREKKFLKSEKSRIAEDKIDRKTGRWKLTSLGKGVEDIVMSLEDDKIKGVSIYAEPDLKSKVIALLKMDTPILLMESKLRYDKLGKNKEGWVRIEKPVKGWLSAEFVGLWYSDFFTNM